MNNDINNNNIVKKLYTPKEVAKVFKVSHKTVYNWCDEGKIPFIKIGGTVRILSSGVDVIFINSASTRYR